MSLQPAGPGCDMTAYANSAKITSGNVDGASVLPRQFMSEPGVSTG